MGIFDEFNWDDYKDEPLPSVTGACPIPPPEEEKLGERWSEDPVIASVEADCATGDMSRATAGIQRLLDMGTDPRRLGSCCNKAAKSGNVELVRYILQIGVRISNTAIKDAIRNNRTDLLSLYQEFGWDLNQEESWTQPPLLAYATGPEADESVILWFLSHGADPNRACQADQTPLSYACLDGPRWLVSRLLEHVPTDAAAARGNLLHWAARRRTDDSVEVLRLILDRGQFDLNGIEGVHSPVWFEGFRLAGLGTPLHVAAKGGNVEMVKELLRRGSDASIRDTLGRTAVEVAEQEGHMSVVQAMRQLEPQKRSNLGARI